MLKRWAAWPRSIRWLVGGLAAVVLALAIAWVLFVPAADWLARHDVGSAGGPLLQTARDAARGRLLTLGAGLFAAGALVFTARNFTLSRRTFELTEQGQVTDRYTKAIEQLGSDKLDVRIGGIYALESVARDSARHHPAITEVLTAFIREHSREQWRPPVGGGERERWTRPDVQAALTAIGRRDPERDIPSRHIDLTRADLTRADLTAAELTGADLTAAELTGADLIGANLGGADLTGANLSGAVLELAYLAHANLDRANLRGAFLQGAQLYDTNLGGADLTAADLTDVQIMDVDLTGATWPRATPVPEGWKLDTGSGLLEPGP
jgi:Pentapeptide repeats (8 copies)